jgi:hypothetical protein
MGVDRQGASLPPIGDYSVFLEISGGTMTCLPGTAPYRLRTARKMLQLPPIFFSYFRRDL